MLGRAGYVGVGWGASGFRLGESRCGIQSLRALHTPPLLHNLLTAEFMAPDIVCPPTPLYLLGPCAPFRLSTLAPPQLPGSLEPGQVLQFRGPRTVGPFC